MYVLYLMFANAIGVTITTRKLKSQLAVVAMALAGARMERGVISAGYNLKSVCMKSVYVSSTIFNFNYAPRHAQPSDGEEGVEHEEKNCRADAVARVALDARGAGQDRHGDGHAGCAEHH
jgi:hypothetical protein